MARVLYFVLLSLVAAVLVVVVFIIGSGQDHSTSSSDRILPGAAFVASCLLCISLSVFPNWGRNFVSQSSRSRAETNHYVNSRKYRGHHPDCIGFQTHRISLGHREYCSGCLGLMSGAALSIPLMIIYAASGGNLPKGMSVALMALGCGVVLVANVEAAIGSRRPSLHLFANSIMIVGFFLLVVGMLEATGNGVSGLLVVSFSFLWIDTRIQLSNWRHSLVCSECPEGCKMY